MKYALHILFLFLLSLLQFVALADKRLCRVGTANTPISIDGSLNEAAWQTAGKADSFIQNSPTPGIPSTKRTEVRVLYDNKAVYIGARMYDPNPDSILKQLSVRDDFSNNNDYFGLTFDTYDDKQNATVFIVTAAGVQADGVINQSGSDYSWNAAWYSKVVIDSLGWTVEMKIPYSALRFPRKQIQQWGVNFFRLVRRNRESMFWSNVDPKIAGLINQEGVLVGIHDIVPPLRLGLFPYVSSYAENYAGANAHTLNGGMDIKYGFNESFTLDLTLIPDFGQTMFDSRVLNLSAVEVKYDEKRYFFTEGLNLFNKDNLFYTRRVGGAPINDGTFLTNQMHLNEVVDVLPSSTVLYNALKVSGYTKKKLGIGFFNALSAPTSATVRDTVTGITRKIEVSPFTNYNVLVLDQTLKNNSYLSFINTNVNRRDNSYNADVSALLFKFANKKNTYGIDGSGDMSQIYGGQSVDLGYKYNLDLARLSGNYTWNLYTKGITDHYNPNDLGYLDRNNIVYYGFGESYNIYKPFWKINKVYNYWEIDYYRAWNPNHFMQVALNGNHSITTLTYLSYGCYWFVSPTKSYDFLEPRTMGRFYVYPENYMAGAFISTDYRKKFALDINGNNTWFSGSYRNTASITVAPRYRFSDRFSMVYGISLSKLVNDVGFVDNIGGDIYFGMRNLTSVTHTLDAAFIFTNTMSLKADLRHYWSQVAYSSYHLLGDDGLLYNTAYNTSHDIDFNTFNAYLSFVWQYSPGSEMSLVYQNSIFQSSDQVTGNYYDNFQNTLGMPQSNSLSIKVIYYVDYLYLRSKIRQIQAIQSAIDFNLDKFQN